MKERPIIMSGNHPKLILDGIKTQTRRVCKGQIRMATGITELAFYPKLDKRPYGQVGDRLWIKHRYDLFGVYYKPIEGYEGIYSAGTDGHIYRMDKGEPRVLQEDPTGDKGYLAVSLSNGLKSTQLVHRLVVKAFYGLPPADLYQTQTRHLDGNNQNNLPSNLDWGTQEDNWGDRKYHGRGMREQHHNSKLTIEQVGEILASTKSQRQLAYIYRVAQQTIQSVKAGTTWGKHLTQPDRNYPMWQGWKSPLFMPRWASRITLEITEVRVERVHQIGMSEDLIKEGMPQVYYPNNKTDWAEMLFQFSQLWDSLNAKRGYGWEVNPWVWVISFKRIEL